MKDPIAIVGAACEYPDASSPAELWENILAGRRTFRRLPNCRLRLEDYFSDDPQRPDATYAANAALITNYQFDRARFRVVGSTFRSADMVQWLALDVASRALADAGFPDGEGLPKDQVGVLIGNSLTGEFSRERDAASLAVRPSHRGCRAGRTRLVAGRSRRFSRHAGGAIQGAVPTGRRRDACGRTFQHDCRTDLQPFRLPRRRLYRRRRAAHPRCWRSRTLAARW